MYCLKLLGIIEISTFMCLPQERIISAEYFQERKQIAEDFVSANESAARPLIPQKMSAYVSFAHHFGKGHRVSCAHENDKRVWGTRSSNAFITTFFNSYSTKSADKFVSFNNVPYSFVLIVSF